MLSALCLSLVPILRCVALKRVEFSTLLIPPGVELLFSVALLCKRGGGRGRYSYLLGAEGVAYFLLALMDFLTHSVPALHQDLLVFKIIDITLGGLALVPLLLFTVWFLFTAQRDLIHIIPARLRTTTKCVSMACVPLTIVSSAAGAFVGISYRTLGGVNAVGFIDDDARLLWRFFNAFSLALLAIFEALAFFLLFARLMKVVLHKRRRELTGGTGEVHHFRGIVLINLGMLLSLVETLIGFADQGFPLAFTRRGMKAAGRILMILGLLRGWDHLEDVRFVLQRPPKSKRISKFSALQLFSGIRSPGVETQVSEFSDERVSIRRPRGRAPTLHLRLSEFDVTPIMKTLRSPAGSHNSLRAHLIPEMTPTGSTMEIPSEGYLDVQHLFHGNPPSDIPTSPTTPNSFWTVTGPTPRTNSSSNHAGSPRPSTRTQDETLHHQTHARGDTMSSTMSNLQMEVMTLSESPPDPGFVLPIPSRSRSRQNYATPPIDFTQTMELDSTEYSRVNREPHRLSQATLPRHIPPMNESNPALPPLDPPRLRHSSWTSERSDASSAVISTVTRLTRANTGVNMTFVTVRRTPGVIPGDRVLARPQSATPSDYMVGSPLSAVHTERPGGDKG